MGKPVIPRLAGRNSPAVAKPTPRPAPATEVYNPNPVPVDATQHVSLIERKRAQLLRALEDGKPASIVTADLTKVMLQAMIDLLPELEKGAKASSRAVYALDKVAALTRELAHDLRSMEDRDAMREKLMNGIIDPALLDFANKNVTELNRLSRIVNDNAEAVDFIQALKVRVSTLVNGLHVNVANSLDGYFGGSKDAVNIVSESDGLDDDDYFEEPDSSELVHKSKIASRRS